MLWCLHGALGSFRDWERILPEGQHVDLWSTASAEDMRQWGFQWSAEVAAIDPEPILLGYSMGGRLALHALLAAPDLWKGAIMVAAHPGLRDLAEREKRLAVDADWLRRFQTEPIESVMVDWNAQPVFAGTPRLMSTQFAPAMSRSFVEWSLGRQEPLWDQLGRIRCPVTWICGERDRKFTAIGRAAVALMSEARYLEAPACGHRVPWEWVDFPGHVSIRNPGMAER